MIRAKTDVLVLGAVAYDPKVVSIWDGFQRFFEAHGLPFDYVLYTNYERQVEGHFAGEIDVAWNSPLAWIEADRLAPSAGKKARAIAMRDTDRDLTSVILVRKDGGIRTVQDLAGRRVAVGAFDSPQATILPLLHLAEHGLAARAAGEPSKGGPSFEYVLHDVLVGKHGDHVGGERDAVKALVRGEVDAACCLDANTIVFANDGTAPEGSLRPLATTAPFDHCNFTVLDDAKGAPSPKAAQIAKLTELLLGMSYADPAIRPLMDLEGLKQWKPGRIEGYAPLARACDRFGTIDAWLGAMRERVARGGRLGTLMRVDLDDLGLDRGGHLLLKRALARVAVGGEIEVHGRAEGLEGQLRAFCRAAGHEVRFEGGDRRPVAIVVRGDKDRARSHRAERAGHADPRVEGAVVDRPPPTWGLAARGSLVEAGVPPFSFPLAEKSGVWADDAARLYAQAAAAQWDPAKAIAWSTPFELPDEVEDAVVQVMTYLVENETAALVVPARFVAKLHPHFREVMQLLAIQTADEARHIEVFTRRALLKRNELGLSTVGGQASLKTLVDEQDFALASFLLSVLGEGSFLSLLWFLHEHAPDPITREIARLAAQDEARHVAFGLAHLERHLAVEPDFRPRLRAAVEARHEALRHTSGLNEEVFDALVLLAAGGFEPSRIADGHRRVVALKTDMDENRRKRLQRLGFDDADARTMSALHTRNFM